MERIERDEDKTICVRIPADIHEEVRKRLKRKKLSMNALINYLLRKWLREGNDLI